MATKTRKAARREALPTAFSYLRFSNPEQADGDSVRRQTAKRDTWLALNGAVLDTSLSMRDEGVSAFTGAHRENPDRHALAAFLELVRRGRIPRGSYLIVESLDRLSREHIRPALTLLLNLIDQGVRIVQLLPVEVVYDEHVEPMHLLMAIMELSRGHSESKMKSERVGEAWRQKKENAAKDGKPITRRTTAWLSVKDGEFVIVEERAEIIRRVFRLATEGTGIGSIVKQLNGADVKPIGHARCWIRSYVGKLLSNRTTFGEFQPYTRRGGIKRQPDGPPIPNYYPPIVTEQEFEAAQGALESRRLKGGRPTERVNLFTHLLKDARTGSNLHIKRGAKKSPLPVLIPQDAWNGVRNAKMVSFPLPTFETAILTHLREIKLLDVLSDGNSAETRALALGGKLADLDRKIAKMQGQLVETEDPDDPLIPVVRALGDKRRSLAVELTIAQREAASPLAEAWTQTHTLIDLLADGDDVKEKRTRLRSALRRTVEEMRCLFVARGAQRLAAVQAWLKGGKQRSYLILHKPAFGNGRGTERSAQMWSRSLADIVRDDDLDLRRLGDVKALERELLSLDLATIING